MFNKNQMRLKAMDKMMRDKPSIVVKKKPDFMDEGSEDEASDPSVDVGEMGNKGMVSMPVSPEEKMMILKLRKQKDYGDMHEVEESEEEMA